MLANLFKLGMSRSSRGRRKDVQTNKPQRTVRSEVVMSHKYKKILTTAAAFSTIALATPQLASAQSGNSWDHLFGIYLWGTGIEGVSSIGPVTAPINITFSDALDNLDSALMLHYEGRSGDWGVLADVMHIGLDPEAALPSGAPAAVDLTNNVVEFGGIYKPQSSEAFELLFGIRYTELEIDATIGAAPKASLVDEEWVDAFVGGRLVGQLSDNWRLIGRADVGTGDSDLVWNATATIDYRFNDRVSALFGYRWLDYDYDNGKAGPDRFTYDARYEGPIGAVVFYW